MGGKKTYRLQRQGPFKLASKKVASEQLEGGEGWRHGALWVRNIFRSENTC
jgi:hypothetical protein